MNDRFPALREELALGESIGMDSIIEADIRELLAAHDALAKECKALREALVRLASEYEHACKIQHDGLDPSGSDAYNNAMRITRASAAKTTDTE